MIKRIVVLLSIIIGLVFIPNVNSNAQQGSRAGLVVQNGDGSVESFCLSFEGESIKGYELLELSGLDLEVVFSPLGAAVCSIGALGCPADDTCLKCQEPLFWSYWRLTDNEWVYSTQGASIREVRNGDVDAWVWGYGGKPASTSFEEICSQSQASTPAPTETQTPFPTFTTQATKTSIPTFTSLPALAATITSSSIPIPSITASPTPSKTLAPVLTISETPIEPTLPESASVTQNQGSQITATITPIIVHSIPTEHSQSIPANGNLPPKKVAPDASDVQDITQPTPTPVPKDDFKIGSVISVIIQTVQNLVKDILH